MIKPALMGAVSEQALLYGRWVVLSSAFESRVAIGKILALAQSLPFDYALGFDTATAFMTHWHLNLISEFSQSATIRKEARAIWDDFRI